MHGNGLKTMPQQDLRLMKDERSTAANGHVHDWVTLGLGFEMCTICKAIRRTPKNYAAGTQPSPRRIIGPLIAVARRRLARHRGGR
jgi:hypothetical protein